MTAYAPLGEVSGDIAPARRSTMIVAIAVLTLNLLIGAALRLVFAPVVELAKADLHLSDTQLGLIQGIAGALPIAFLSLPLGRLTDRANRVRLLAGITIVSIAGTALAGMASSFAMLFAGRMLGVLAGFCALPVAISIAADLVAPQLRGRAMLFLQLGLMIGSAIAFAVAGKLAGLAASALPVAGLAPWRQAQLLLAGAGLLSMASFLLLRDPPRREIAGNLDIPLSEAFAEIGRRAGFIVPLYIGQVTVVMADMAASVWAAPVLTRDYHLTPDRFGGWMGLVILLSGILGAVLGGLAADFGQKGKLPGGMLAAAIAAAAVSIPAAFFAVMPSATDFAWALGLLLTCGGVTGLVTATALSVYMPNEVRGFCLGLFIVVGAVGGLGIAPSLVPWVSALLGGEGHVGLALAIVGAVTSVVALVGFVFAIRHQPLPPAA
ncbi:MFS transporter [Sphingomonas sp. CGMCC 1.13654]|uniref:MFS transporter n=1 Tax=Sphingomonas chungangi TaxID=2683589 RepID=A0A838L5U6_9SPHN|nr:MFS transporter [Sphingomonas chungangi]MBA2934300.1 MFS transporter [Sphingomonas chungangi]MVW57341.1 MFS transporter [Sphingomonas chungangi]